MKTHRPLLLLLTCILSVLLCACSPLAYSEGDEPETKPAELSEYDGELYFDGRRYTYKGDAENISAEADRLTVKKGGSYLLSGELSEGRIIIDCAETVRLCLGGVSLSSATGAVIEQRRGGLIIETLGGSINRLESKSAEGDGILPHGCVYSTGDISFLGSGSLFIGSECDGVSSGGSVYVEGGEISLRAKKRGIFARNSIAMTGGELTVTYAETGMYAFGGEYSRGSIAISGGRLVAVCSETGLFAEREIYVCGGGGEIKAKTPYKCERTADGKTEKGSVNITVDSFAGLSAKEE